MRVLARRLRRRDSRVVQLFKSHSDGIVDGDQRRDFIYVDNVVRVVMWLLATPKVSGLLNVGTGTARSFKDLMLSAMTRSAQKPNIQHIDMPESIRSSWQYFTQAKVDRLRLRAITGASPHSRTPSASVSKATLDTADRYR
jgi:ADP-L-glycero-D-manno-heptose 6-epimerase